MIAVLKHNVSDEQKIHLISWLKSQGLDVHISDGKDYTVLGLVGDTGKIDPELLASLEIVQTVRPVSEPYKKCSRKFHPDDSVISVGGASFGGGTFSFIAGPCSVESREQIIYVAKQVKEAGATALRGGAFKPRTSPYAFQGLRGEGIRLLLEAKKVTGLPIVTEVMDISQLELFNDVDVIQIGARNMQNFELLKEVGRCNKPVLLKRGLANTYQELLMSAEYLMASGNEQVMLCERGVRTFETYTRNTLDISAIPALKILSHLPIIIDPSHAAGRSNFVAPLSMAAVAAGADGLIIEVHNDPSKALCDGPQSLTMPEFDKLAGKLRTLKECCGNL